MARNRQRRARRQAEPAPAPIPRAALEVYRPFLVLLALVAVVYVNSVSNEFVFDDHLLVSLNPEVNPAVTNAIEHRRIEYRPFRILSYVFDRQIGGHRPESYHVGNMVYHAITSCLALVTYQQLGLSPTTALLGAAIFAVHPVQTESVTYISGRRDVLCGLFVLLAFSLYMRWRAAPGRLWHLAGAVVALAGGVLAKEVAFAFPLLVVAYDLTVSLARQRGTRPSQSVISAALAVLRAQRWSYAVLVLLGLAGVGYLAVTGIATSQAWWGGTPVTNGLNVALLWVHAGVLLVFPLRLLADYSYQAVPVITTVASPLAWAAVAAVLALFAVSCWTMHRTPVAVFLLWWIAATLLPSSHVLPHHDFFGEHYLYLSVFGFAGLLALTLVRAGRQLGIARRHGEIVCLALLFLYGARTVVRNRDWRDDLTLWRVTSAAAPRSARAHSNYGGALLAERDLLGARREFKAALRISRSVSAMSGMVMIHHAQGRLARRDALLRRMMQDPGVSYTTMVTLAGWFLLNGEYPVAIRVAREAAARPYADDRAVTVEAWAHARGGELAVACPLFDAALRRNPTSPDARSGREFCRQHAAGAR